MIRLSDPGLDAETAQRLNEYQQEVNAAATYADRVASAKTLFSQRNRPTNAAFRNVRQSLALMCAGAQRCVYCEDSVGDEVEHIQPKDLYPCLVFVWTNYIFACGRCNGGKSNMFAVMTENGIENVTRRRGDPVVPPTPGAPIFINPRWDDPLNFLDLDLQRTFFLLPRDNISQADQDRADFTIETLKLNRDVLTMARSIAYGSYRARLHEYVARRDEATTEEVTVLENGIKTMPHRTVWAEMKRQHKYIPCLQRLFSLAPEALNW